MNKTGYSKSIIEDAINRPLSENGEETLNRIFGNATQEGKLREIQNHLRNIRENLDSIDGDYHFKSRLSHSGDRISEALKEIDEALNLIQK